MNARIYLCKLGLVFLALCSLWVAAFYWALGRPVVDAAWSKQYYDYKIKAAESIEAPKIILSGGSGVLYSISAEELSSHLDVPVINMGVYAGLGLPYILDKTAAVAQSGDLVILIFEYDHFDHDGQLQESYVNYVTSHDREYFDQLPIMERIKIIAGYSFRQLQRVASTKQGDLKVSGHYSMQNLSPLGDQWDTEQIHRSEQQWREVRKESPISADDLSGREQSWDELNAFAEAMSERNVDVIAMFPSTLIFDNYNEPEYSQYFQRISELLEENGIHVAGDSSDFMWEADYFYDTKYHLTAEGRAIATKQAAALLEGGCWVVANAKNVSKD